MSDAIESKEWFGKLDIRFICLNGMDPSHFSTQTPTTFPYDHCGVSYRAFDCYDMGDSHATGTAGTSAAERQRVRRVFTSFQLIDLPVRTPWSWFSFSRPLNSADALVKSYATTISEQCQENNRLIR